MTQLCDAPFTTIPLTDITFIAPHTYSSKLELLRAFNLQVVAGVSLENPPCPTPLSDCSVIRPEGLFQIHWVGVVRDIHFTEGVKVVTPHFRQTEYLLLVDSGVFTLPLSLPIKAEEGEN